jgi:hypothetical protein
MKFIYGPKPVKNTKQSKLGFPSIVGGKPPLERPMIRKIGEAQCPDCHMPGVLYEVQLPNPVNN